MEITLNFLNLFKPKENSTCIRSLIVYEYQGGLVFDDPSKGLEKEAFISGIDDMIFKIMEAKDLKGSCKLTFSPKPFPDFDVDLQWYEHDKGGNWYYCQSLGMYGWLCPALYHYFDYEPARLFVKVSKAK